MKNRNRNALKLAAGIGATILVLRWITAPDFIARLKAFLPSVEGFTPTPIWDYRQWSWGYGTKVPGSSTDPNKKPPGSITRAAAWEEALKFIRSHYSVLQPQISTILNANQLAAFLSFSYNTGTGNADNLIPLINSGNQAALFDKWRQYVYAGGQYNQGLANRREKEIKLWQGTYSLGAARIIPIRQAWEGLPVTDHPAIPSVLG